MAVKGFYFTVEGLLSLLLLLLIITAINIPPEYPAIKQSMKKEQMSAILQIWNHERTEHQITPVPAEFDLQVLCIRTLGKACATTATEGVACIYSYTTAGLQKICIKDT